jgi:CheY-like chemotaxis protein
MIVDDNADNRFILRARLEKLGEVKVTEAANGLEAVEQIVAGYEPDLVFLDLQMPVLDGYQAVRRIRELGGRARTVPIVALTGYASVEHEMRALELGCDAFLTKPVQLADLRDKLARFLPR